MSASECRAERIGWFGKIPAAGDFVGRGLPANLVRCWDEWLSAELCEARRLLSERWAEAYSQMPVLCVLLGPGALTENALQGILLPSVDRVGREFPLLIAQCCRSEPVESPEYEWWNALVCTARQSLEQARSADAMDELLAMFVRGSSAGQLSNDLDCEPIAGARILVGPGQSAWWRFEAGGRPAALPSIFDGLPPGLELRKLLGLAE